MKKYFILALILASCSQKTTKSHLISLQMIDRNGQTETISQTARIELLEKQDFSKPQPYEKILRVYSKNSDGKNPSIITTYHKNGQLFQALEALDGRAFGAYKEYYETGQLHIEACVIEGTADLTNLAQSSWVFDGPCSIFYPSGACLAEFQYALGKRSGPSCYYYENGDRQKSLYFLDDLAEGEVCEYYSNRHLKAKYQFLKGEQIGESIGYHENGQIFFQESWVDNFIEHAQYFKPNGEKVSSIDQGNGIKSVYENQKLISQISFKNGVPEGLIKEFNQKGSLSSYYHIQNGQKHGEETLFYEDSNTTKMRLEWNEDTISGLVKTFYKDGSLESQKSYSQNKKNGPSTIYYPSGDLMMLETYSQDKLVEGKYYKKGEKIPASYVEDGQGTALFFDEWGAIKQEISYEKGKAVLPDE
jgi:antitoxin component YwqK of YwqJK toxin-antitoxin module